MHPNSPSDSSVPVPAGAGPPSAPARHVVVGALALWGITVGVGMGLMLLYEKNPGRVADAPAHWPSQSRIPRQPGRPTLVMILHPRCPCSSASAEQLARVLARARRPLQAVAVMVRPAGTSPGWERTSLWDVVAAIPGVTVLSDPEGLEAARFGSWTSGQVLLYDDAGRLRFAGGITGSRGMAGDNAGASAALAQIETGSAGAARAGASVYGCELRTPSDNSRPKGASR